MSDPDPDVHPDPNSDGNPDAVPVPDAHVDPLAESFRMMNSRGLRRRVGAAIALAVAFSILSPPAGSRAASSFTFYGSGWGHGLGLPQWGAYGLALKGWSHQKILSHYYQDTKVGVAPSSPSRLRVGLTQDRKIVNVTAAAGTVALRLGSTKGKLIGGRAIKQGKTWRVNVDASGKYRVLDENGKLVGDCSTCKGHLWGGTKTHIYAVYSSTGKARVKEAGHTYNRGYIEFNLYGSKSCSKLRYCERLIAVVSPQAYLYGLAEVPSGWPMVVLEVQSVAARTYAFEKVSRLGQRRSGCNCGLYDDVRDQVYAGWDKEGGPQGSRWVTAVKNTNGTVVLYKGAPIQAYYHSSSGGYTENNEFVWGGTPLPYLRGVCDPGDYSSGNPNRVWKTGPLSDATVTQKLRPYTGNIGTVTKFSGPVRGVSGRIVTVTVVGTSGQKEITGTSLRRGLGLKDSLVWFNVDRRVIGDIRTKYDRLMCAPGLVASTRQSVPGGLRQRFAKGAIYRNEARAGTYWLHGPIYDKYRALGDAEGWVGLPRSDIVPRHPEGCEDRTCSKTRFEHANVYFKEGIGDGEAHELHGYVLLYYIDSGETNGDLGFPVTDVTTEEDGSTWAKFEHGTVRCSSSGDCAAEGAGADLSVHISDSPDPLKVRAALTYVVTVRNHGPGLATDVVLTDNLHSSVILLSAKPSRGSCSGTDPVVCSLGSLRKGATATVKIVVRVTQGGGVTGVGRVDGSEPDPTPGNDSASARTVVCTRLGTPGANVLRGTSGRDVMCGLGGNDTIYGLGGDDLIYAGGGHDVVYGGSGADRLYGSSGSDRLYGSWGA
ncbi:MAG: SpoIID/LytB domain-containing protein, partial [Actinomycetota bacterium]